MVALVVIMTGWKVVASVVEAAEAIDSRHMFYNSHILPMKNGLCSHVNQICKQIQLNSKWSP